MGQKLRHVHAIAVVVVLLKLKLGRSNREPSLTTGHSRDSLTISNRIRKILVEFLFHLWLVVKQVHLARTTVHEQHDDALGFRREVRHPRQAGSRLTHVDDRLLLTKGIGRSHHRPKATSPEQSMESGRADSHRRSPEEFSSGHDQFIFADRVHGLSVELKTRRG